MIALTVFICSLLSEIVVLALTKDDTFYQTDPYPLSVALFISGLVAFYINEKISENCRSGKHSGMAHSLFFIPVKYWGWILISLSILVFTVRKFGAIQ